MNQWRYLTFLSSAVFLLLLPSVFPRIRVFSHELTLHIMRPKYWSFSSSISSFSEYSGWFPLGLTGLISLKSRGFPRVFSSTPVWKHQFSGTQPSLWSNSHIRTWLLEKTWFDYKEICWLSNVSAVGHSFYPKEQVSFNFMAAVHHVGVVMLEPKKIKSITASTFPPSICHKVMGPDAMILIFLNAEF